MHHITTIGLNHKTAPIEIRECLAFSVQEAITALEVLSRTPAIEEALLLSTCNRVEILMFAADNEAAIDAVKTFLAEFRQVPAANFENVFYIHHGESAVQHIFRVASSLDSMVVGEPQILGQVKEAYRMANQAKTTGVVLNRLMHRTFSVAKKIRTETGIGDHAVSISYAAIELARKIFGSLENKKSLLIGAGEMAELAVEHLIRHNVGDLYVANRTFENGVALAGKYKGKAIRFEEIPDRLPHVDIIISSTGSPGFIITQDQVRQIRKQRKNRPIFFIDIAVPRDIDPEIDRLSNAYVYDIDDLQGVIDGNIEDRRQSAVQGERIVDEAVIHFRDWFDNLKVVPTIVALREKVERIANAEVEKTVGMLSHLSPDDVSAIQRMTTAMINKLLHDPIYALKHPGKRKDSTAFINLVRKLFNLDS